MEYPCDEINDLPDEILLTILKELSNIEVLYSLFGIDQRLNRIVQDSFFTSHLTLFERSTDQDGFISNYLINPLSDSMINRFCLQILPNIHHKIKWIDVEPTCIERVLFATKYPNLSGLGIYDVDIGDAVSLLTNEHILNDIRNQVVSLDVDIPHNRKHILRNNLLAHAFACVFDMFTNLQCLKFALTPVRNQLLFSNDSLPTVRSSTLLELHVSVHSFSDCLYLLDGRFSQLQTFHVHLYHIRPEQLTAINQEELPNLKCFLLYCDDSTNYYDQLVVPLLHRMINLEKLDLCLLVDCARHRGFVDGNDLKENIIKYMPQLKEFKFDICTFCLRRDRADVPSNEDVQRTFEDFPNQVVAWTDYFERKWSQCYIHSYPYRMRHFEKITNQFPGGLFRCVTRVSLYDQYPFEREFFVRIEKSFPMVRELTIVNQNPQKNKLHGKSKHNDQDMSIITYRHLVWLGLLSAHEDYVEQFLFDTEVSVPNNVYLLAEHKSLKKVTHNFQREETRINCAKMIYLCTNRHLELPEHIDDYFALVEKD